MFPQVMVTTGHGKVMLDRRVIHRAKSPYSLPGKAGVLREVRLGKADCNQQIFRNGWFSSALGYSPGPCSVMQIRKKGMQKSSATLIRVSSRVIMSILAAKCFHFRQDTDLS